MTTVQLYYRQQFKSLSLAVESYDVAIELLRYFVNDLLGDGTKGFAFAIKNRGYADFPTLQFQQCDDACLLQVYATELMAIDGKEGWHCLVESGNVGDVDVDELVVDELVKVATDGSIGEEYRSVRFAEGALFSRTLLATTDTVKSALAHYTGESNIREWLRKGKWVNLGLL